MIAHTGLLPIPTKRHGVDYEMGFWLEDAEKSARNYVAELPAGEIDLGDGRILVHPALSIRPDDRIALVGANGIGKSTLVRKIVSCANVPSERLLVVPQEIGEEESRAIHADVKRLDRSPLGRVMTLISRLGSKDSKSGGNVLHRLRRTFQQGANGRFRRSRPLSPAATEAPSLWLTPLPPPPARSGHEMATPHPKRPGSDLRHRREAKYE